MKKISTEELARKQRAGENPTIIDVREDEEVAAGKIPEAKHIPLGELPDRLAELNKDDHYYIICRSGGRSGQACQMLTEQGYQATNVDGGMLSWNEE